MNFTRNLTGLEADQGHKCVVDCVCEHDHVTYSMQCWIEPIVLLTGIIVDILALLVLTQKSMRSSTTMYLIAMTTYDTCYLIFYSSNYWRGCSSSPHESPDYHWYHRYVGEPIMTLFSNSTTVTICVLSMERYVAVCHPHRFSTWSVVQFSQKVIAAAFFLTLLCTVPEFFRNDFDAQLDKIGYEWIEDTTFTYLPILFLIVCNSHIVYTLCKESKLKNRLTTKRRRSDKKKKDSSSSRFGYSRLTIRLVVIVSVFIVCALPGAMLSSYHGYASFNDELLEEDAGHLFKMALQLSNLLNPINAIANFIVNNAPIY